MSLDSPFLSVFTPTHHDRYLREAWRSLQWQQFDDFEWVLAPNGEKARIPDEILKDPRVRVLPHSSETKIGKLKKEACLACRGQAFVELDHDDVLAPGVALMRIAEQIKKGAGFVFSDTAVVHGPKLKPHAYEREYGWASYPVNLYGRQLEASQTFPVTPRALCDVYYAPDHVRVWERKAYLSLGGHDENLSVGDDHDLICRTYLSGRRFAHTGGCHYFYRYHGDNTVIHRNPLIQSQNKINREKYLLPLIREWTKQESLASLELGIASRKGWKWSRDLEHGFGVDAYGAIWSDFRLGACSPDRFVDFLNHAYVGLCPGGYLVIQEPRGDGPAAFLDPTRALKLTPESFLATTLKTLATQWPEFSGRFQWVASWDYYPSQAHEQRNMAYFTLVLSALKGQRQPGRQLI